MFEVKGQCKAQDSRPTDQTSAPDVCVAWAKYALWLRFEI